MTETEHEIVVPHQLIELHESGKPREVAAGYLQHFRPQLEMALNYNQVRQPQSGTMSMEAFAASVELEVTTNEYLQQAMHANPASFMKAITLAAQCKLLVGGAFDLFYLIPRKNRKEGRLEVTPLIGYKGLSDMAQRHPRVHKVDAVLVFEGERFSYNPGMGKLDHDVPLTGVERTEEKLIGGYARVVITEPLSSHPVHDDPVIHVMNRDQLMAIKERSDAYQQAERAAKQKGWTPRSPWHTDPLPMHRKTLLRAVLNGGSVPRDMGIGMAITTDDKATVAQPVEQVKAMPASSRTDSIAEAIGVIEKAEPFEDLPDEVASMMDQAETIGQLEALRRRANATTWEEVDRQIVDDAWARNDERLSE